MRSIIFYLIIVAVTTQAHAQFFAPEIKVLPIAYGNVGIGTETPAGKLEIKAPYNGQSQLIINTTSSNAELRFSENGVLRGFVWYNSSGNLMSFGRGGLSNSLHVTSDGKFGIGTGDPNAKLDIRDGHLYVGDEVFSNPNNWGQTINLEHNVHARILIEERTTGVRTALASHTGGSSRVGTLSNHAFGIMSNGANRITVRNTGEVGIGTEDPGYELDVVGVIHASGTGNWPDYVFDHDYRLSTLADVEAKIETSGHLSGIPSAEEVERNGVDLVDMDARLLKKIEELTLYLIEHDKVLKLLSLQLETQQREIESLKKQLE